jgi:peptide/nickel transport system substrate-binding protein
MSHSTPRSVGLMLIALALLTACGASKDSAPNAPERVLTVVPVADLEILDPSWTSLYVTRDHAFMIYDTLFGFDADRKIAPQMVDTWQVSDDKKVWTFTLREGLEFHDGAPVTSEDVIASLRRWSLRDALGQRLLAMSTLEAVNATTFRINLKAPWGSVLDALAKPDSYVPFIYPKRIAETPASKQIEDTIGSGPFIFKRDEWRPGEKIVYVRNPRYKPRPEPPSGTAGGKQVKVDRVEWVVIKDPQTQANALMAGDVDIIVEPPYALYPPLQRNPGIQMFEGNTLGHFFYLRFNHREPPFDNLQVRQAAVAAMKQSDFLQTQVGLPEMYRTCFSFYHCETPYASTEGMDSIATPDMNRARQLLKASGYAGTPVVVLQASDMSTLSKLPVTAAQLLRQAGFTVDLQSIDQNTVSARRNQPQGWSIFVGYGSIWSSAIPTSMNLLSGACYPKAFYGWACDARLEALRDAFGYAGTEEDRKKLATQIQVRAMEIAAYVPLGEARTMLAARKNVTGFVKAPIMAFWNLEKH